MISDTVTVGYKIGEVGMTFSCSVQYLKTVLEILKTSIVEEPPFFKNTHPT